MMSDVSALAPFIIGFIFIAAGLDGTLHEIRIKRQLIQALRRQSPGGFARAPHESGPQANMKQRATQDILSELFSPLMNSIRSEFKLITQARHWHAMLGLIGLASLSLGCAVYFVFMTGLGAVFIFAAGLYGGFRLYSSYLSTQRTELISRSLPLAVDALIRCLRSGFDLSRSLTIISDEVPAEMRSEFQSLLRNRDLGLTLGQAMYQMAERLGNAEALFLATLIAIQERSGGPLIQALESLSQILREREKLRQKRLVASAEARMSALILGGLPVAVTALLFLTNPSYREVLLSTQSGRLLLMLGGALLIIGTAVMARMIRMDKAV